MSTSLTLDDAKLLMCAIGKRIYARQLVAGSEGNVSLRLPGGNILCTPTGLCKGRLAPQDLCEVNLNGEQLSGERKPSSEIKLHLEILKACEASNAVVHTHPPYAVALAVHGKAVPRYVTPEAELFFGEIPMIPYETPGTLEFAQAVLPFMPDSNACLLAHHGAVTHAADLETALNLTELLEAHCRTIHLARQLGELPTLPEDKQAELKKIDP